MKMDEIKILLLNYDCNDIRCLNCGENPKDGKSWNIEHQSYSVTYTCQCGLFAVYYGFHKTTNTRADYDITSTQCHKCGSTENYDIDQRVLGEDLVWELGCCECEARWTEFYKYHGLNLNVIGGLLQSNIHTNRVIFMEFNRFDEFVRKYKKRKIPDVSGDNLP